MIAAGLPMPMPAVPFFDHREWIARAITLALSVGVAFLSSYFVVEHDSSPPPIPIKVTLADPPPEPPKPPEIMPVTQSIRPVSTQRHTPQPSLSTPIAVSPASSATPVSLPDLPVSPVAREIPAKLETPLAKSDPAAEGRFAQDVRNKIEKKKIYPTTARELGMAGTVEVIYAIDRSGSLLRAEIASSSGYPLLDQAALRAVRTAAYAPFPDDAWSGDKQKEFRTRIVFSLDQ